MSVNPNFFYCTSYFQQGKEEKVIFCFPDFFSTEKGGVMGNLEQYSAVNPIYAVG